MALNELSYCAMHTTFTCAGGAEAIGTSFFYDYDGKTWLVTAAHNVTARHAFTGAELGCPPTDRPVALTLSHCVEEPGEERTRLRIGTCDLPLYDLDGTGRWIHHPHGRHVDIAAMPTSGIPADWKQRTVNDQRLSEVRPFPVTAGESAVILGFPLQGEPRLPFWKAATVATEPDLRNASHFWVDSASRPGMSGGPVFARHSGGLGSDSDPSDGAWGVFYHFIGVYTGRVDDDEFSVQVGRVIRAKRHQRDARGKHILDRRQRVLAVTTSPVVFVDRGRLRRQPPRRHRRVDDTPRKDRQRTRMSDRER